MINKKYICDTNILLSSLLSSSTPPAKTVDFIKEHGIFSFSQATLSEFSEVLKRPKFDKFLSKDKRLNFINEIIELSIIYEIYQKVDICRDPKDNKFLDIAIASYSDFLITGDDDLLVLEKIGNTSIITPREFTDIVLQK